jgi:beta-phosphoglucomutase-like phosphatase (HAD superfamily)
VTSGSENVRELVARTRYVLFGFDGPICRLFPGRSAEAVARVQEEWLTERGLYATLTEEERGGGDPYGTLMAVARCRPGSGLVAELEECLTRFELEASRTALPTAYADPLIHTWVAVGAKLAIATGNSARTVTSYLDSRGLMPCFAPHIYGRSPDLSVLEPRPAILERALNEMGAVPEASLMIGGTPADHAAAHWAGVAFLGYARGDARARALHEAGVPPQLVVASLEPLLRALRERS